jgi:hypothetical protein
MLKKIFIGFLVFFVLIIGALAAIPFVFKDKINALIKEQINKEVLADVEYTSYDLSIFKSFPDLYFTLENLSIVGRDEFAGDTLASCKEIGIGLELMKAIRGEEVLVNSLFFDEPKILAYTLVTDAGDTISNYDIIPPSETADTSSSLMDVLVNDFEIANGKLYYKDFISGMELVLDSLNLEADLTYKGDEANIQSLFKASSVSFSDGSTQYLNKVALDADLDVLADLAQSKYTLQENTIALNALKLYAQGFVELPEDGSTIMDLSFSADKSSFKELLSLIPAEYLKDYEGLQASGNFALKGEVKGKLTDVETPTFDISLLIENGNIQYPDLPSAIQKINLNARIKNTTSNLVATSVEIPNASLTVVNEPIQFSLFAQNVIGDPYVDLKAKGDLDLKRVPEFYPIEGLKSIAGFMHADLAFKGLLSDVEKEQYEKVDFKGDILIDNLVYDAADVPMPVKVDQFSLIFSPQKADFLATNMVLGGSDFTMNGDIENIINYALSDGILKGKLNIQSNTINLDELLGEEEESATEETSTVTKVPANIDFTSSLSSNKVLYDGLTLDNVSGGLTIQDEKLTLDAWKANLLGGSAVINGSYSTKNTEKPEITFAYDIEKFDIQQTFNYMNTVQAIAPLAKYMTGTFSTDLSIASFLNNDLSLDMNMLSGLGEVRIPYATFTDLPIFTKISEAIKIPAFNKPALNNAWTVLKFEDGKVNVEPFQVKMQDMVMDMEGSNGFDQSINYIVKMTVPSDKFGGAATLANDFLSKQKIPLFNLSVPQNITFHLNVTGSLTSPKVAITKVTADQSDKGIKDQIKDSVKEQVNTVKEDIQNKAQAEVEKAKAQAAAEAEKLKQQAQTEAEKLKQKAQEEADKAKENVKDQVKDKLKGFGW